MTEGLGTELRAYRDAVLHRNGWLLSAVVLLCAGFLVAVPVVAVLQLGGAPYEAIHRGDPGVQASLTSALLRAVAEVAACVTFGVLLHQLLLRSTPGPGRLRIDGDLESRVLRGAALVWLLSAAALIGVDAADANGVPLWRITIPGALEFYIETEDLTKAWIVTAFAALITYCAAVFARRWSTLLVGLWSGALGVLAPVVVGHILVGRDHDLGSDAGAIGALAQTALLGALLVAAIRLATGRLIRPASVRRLALLAAVTWPVWLACEIVVMFFKLAAPDAWSTPTAGILLGRIGVILVIGIVLGALGFAHRRQRLDDRALVTGVSALAVLAAAVLALGVVMVRIPPPHFFVPFGIEEILLGFSVAAEPTLAVLATGWRLNLLFAAIAAAAVIVYLAAVVRLRRRGDQWPPGRTIAWLLGWGVVVLATSSGVGRYSGADFAIHMGVHMALNMLAPMLLVMGGVITLLLRATAAQPRTGSAGPHEWITAALHSKLLGALYSPILVFVLFVGSYYGLYLTDLFGEMMRYHWAHQLMNLHFVIVGYLYYGLVIGVDRPPRPLPHLGKLGFVLAAMPFHAFFGIIVMSNQSLIAENFYSYLDLPWAHNLLAIQYVGGGIAWAGGEIPLLIVVTALVTQWARQDRREATRRDRHLDAGRDDDFDAYNDMLRRLAERRARPMGERQS